MVFAALFNCNFKIIMWFENQNVIWKSKCNLKIKMCFENQNVFWKSKCALKIKMLFEIQNAFEKTRSRFEGTTGCGLFLIKVLVSLLNYLALLVWLLLVLESYFSSSISGSSKSFLNTQKTCLLLSLWGLPQIKRLPSKLQPSAVTMYLEHLI